MSLEENELLQFDKIMNATDFYGQDFSARIEATVDESNEMAAITIFLGGVQEYQVNSANIPALYNTLEDFKLLVRNSNIEPLSYRPMVKVLRRDMTF